MKRKVMRGMVLVGAIAVAATAGLAVAESAKNKPVRARSAVTDPVAREVANTLDKVVQDRFRRPLDETFGLSRIARPSDKRMIHSRATIPTDVPLMDKVEAQERSWSVFYLTTRKLSDDGLKALDFPHSGEGLTEVARGKRNAGRALPEDTIQSEIAPLQRYLKEGRSVEAGVSGVTSWRLYGRPVRADKSCVSCHKAAKEGEVLGAVVYAVDGG
ncbi:MAG: hypothetical protein QM758_18190 [Armatimonas sp.]